MWCDDWHAFETSNLIFQDGGLLAIFQSINKIPKFLTMNTSGKSDKSWTQPFGWWSNSPIRLVSKLSTQSCLLNISLWSIYLTLWDITGGFSMPSLGYFSSETTIVCKRTEWYRHRLNKSTSRRPNIQLRLYPCLLTYPSIFRNRLAILWTYRVTVLTERYKISLILCHYQAELKLHFSDPSLALFSVYKWKDSHLNVANKQLSQNRWPHCAVCTGFRMAWRQMEHFCPEDNSSTKSKSKPPSIGVSFSSMPKISSSALKAIANWRNRLLAGSGKCFIMLYNGFLSMLAYDVIYVQNPTGISNLVLIKEERIISLEVNQSQFTPCLVTWQLSSARY